MNSGQVIHDIFLQGMESCFYLPTYLIYHTDSMFAVCDFLQKKNLLTLNTQVKKFSVSPSLESIAVLHQFKDDQLLTVLDCKKRKVSLGKSFKIVNTENVEYILWADESSPCTNLESLSP